MAELFDEAYERTFLQSGGTVEKFEDANPRLLVRWAISHTFNLAEQKHQVERDEAGEIMVVLIYEKNRQISKLKAENDVLKSNIKELIKLHPFREELKKHIKEAGK